MILSLNMKVNGKILNIEELKSKTLLDLIQFYKLNPSGIAIEMNGEILNRENWDGLNLQNEDSIELIKFVGGG
jgi:sulfur carrier protein